MLSSRADPARTGVGVTEAATWLLVALAWIGIAPMARGEMESRTAHYVGDISAEQNQAFFDSVRGRSIGRLVVTSLGGEVEAGIALGRWVFENRIDVEVTEYCLSSCANYVFPAGARKIIRPGAIVAWHGNYRHLLETGLWTDEVASRMERYGEPEDTARRRARDFVERLARVEDDFFSEIGIDGHVCWVGKLPPYVAPNYYFLSRTDMRRFGIDNVATPPGYESTDVSGFDDDIVFIELVD